MPKWTRELGSYVFLLALLQVGSSAYSATVSVCPAGCDSQTIQAAVLAANAGDTIDLLFTNPHTEANIAIDKDLSIVGLDATQTIVQAASAPNLGAGRVFVIQPGVSVTMRAFIVRFGDNINGDGGGIWIRGMPAASLYLEDMTVRDNRADFGGGIANEGLMEAVNTQVLENTAAQGNGGGIYSIGFARLESGSVSDNTATRGGGVENHDIFIAAQTNVVGNTSTIHGGGIYNATQSMMNLNDVDVLANSSVVHGGGIYNATQSMMNLNDLEVSSNQSGDRGAGIYNNGSLTMTQVDVAANYSPINGGGMFLNFGTVTIGRSAFWDNVADGRGGGIYVTNTSSLTIQQSSIHDNSAQSSGGGIYVNSENSEVDLSNVTIEGNSSGLSGGGIYVRHGDLSLANATIAGNNAGSASGGIFRFTSGMNSVLLRSSILAGNTASGGTDPDCNGEIAGSFSLIGDSGVPAGDNCFVGGFSAGMLTRTSPGFGSVSGTGELRVIPLLSSSPAIDAGACISAQSMTLSRDQRNYVMPVDGDGDLQADCDMGAYEYDSVPAPTTGPIFSNGFEN